MSSQRENHEQLALERFEKLAHKYGYHIFRKQKSTTEYLLMVTPTFSSAT